MMKEELGLDINEEDAVKNGIFTFFSFVIFGLIPLLPYLIGNYLTKDKFLKFRIKIIFFFSYV